MTVMTESKAGYPQPGLDAAREGRSFCLRVYAKTGIDSETVLTDNAFLKVVPLGDRLVITRFYVNLTTVSDWVTCEFVAIANEDGSGTITILSPKYHIATGATAAFNMAWVDVDPPIVVKRSDGHAFSAQVQGNDSAAALTLGVRGWTEADTGAN